MDWCLNIIIQNMPMPSFNLLFIGLRFDAEKLRHRRQRFKEMLICVDLNQLALVLVTPATYGQGVPP